jgi:sigma-B regulation protein RsbU (phosphoserine phosphatase)
MTGGIVLGMMADMKFETEKIQLEPGDRIVMFTDGVTEAVDKDDEEFGEARVQEIICQTKSEGAQVLLDRIIEDVQKFSHGMPQADDITMVVMKALSE